MRSGEPILGASLACRFMVPKGSQNAQRAARLNSTARCMVRSVYSRVVLSRRPRADEEADLLGEEQLAKLASYRAAATATNAGDSAGSSQPKDSVLAA